MIICPKCNFDQNADEALFCARCASPLQPGVEAEVTRGQTLAIDTVLQEHYTILNKLSEGGMGAVYLAQDTKLFNKLCVVKEMLPFYNTDQERRIAERNFEREAKTLAHLRHPGIPEIYDYFIEEGRNYLVMAFVEGDDLKDLMDDTEGGLPEQDVIRYGLQMSRALAYLAELNPPTMHRDIKPANIILEKTTGQVKLVDFGIARDSLGSEQVDATKSIVMGTRGYAPPEQFSGRATPASDIYALGATLHHLLTGIHPLQSAVPFQFDSIRSYRPELSPALDAVILEMVRADASQRPMAEDLQGRFERLSGTQVAQTAFVMRSGAEVYSVGELVQACEKNPDAGRFHLVQGHFYDWFLMQNRHDLADWTTRCVSESPDERVALEWFLRGVDSDLPPPTLDLEQMVVDFGEVERDSNYSLLLPFKNSSRGYLLVAAASTVPWLQVETAYAGCYAGEQAQIQLTLDTERMPEGVHKQEALALAWEDQQQRFSVQMKVIWPPGGRLEPVQADLGMLWEGQPAYTYELILNNTGGSEWVGRLASTTRWLGIQGDTFRIPTQVQARIPITIYPQFMQLGKSNGGDIKLVSNGGSQVTTIKTVLAHPWYMGKGRVRRWLAFAAPALLSVAGLVFGVSQLSELVFSPSSISLQQLTPAIMGLATWLLAMLLAAVFIPALDEIEDFHHGGDLNLDTPVFQFDWRKAWPLLVLFMLLCLITGQRYGTMQDVGNVEKGAFVILGLLLGGLVGLGIQGGSSDQIRGTKPLPGLEWLVRKPTVLALLRTFLVCTGLAILIQMFIGFPLTADNWLILETVLLGFILTSDGYPYLPNRVQQVFSWLRPAMKAVFLGLVLQQLLIPLILSQSSASLWSVEGFAKIVFGIIAMVTVLGGAIVGVITHDEVGFDWKQALRNVAPLFVILMITAAVFQVIFKMVLSLFLGDSALWLISPLTLVSLTIFALGITGQSQLVRQYLDRIVAWIKGWFKDTPVQAQDWMSSGAEPIRWFSDQTQVSDIDPFVLATSILISVLLAPVWVQLLGALLWLIVLVGVAAGIFLWWRRQDQTGALWERMR